MGKRGESLSPRSEAIYMDYWEYLEHDGEDWDEGKEEGLYLMKKYLLLEDREPSSRLKNLWWKFSYWMSGGKKPWDNR